MEFHYTAITLGKRDIGETDRLYTLYTREGGKVKAYARGVRKPGARLAPSLEDLSLVSVIIMRGRGTGNIKSSIAEEKFTVPIKEDIIALQSALQSVQWFDRLVGMEEQDEALFDLLVEYLRNISLSPLIRVGFFVQFLSHLGHALQVTHCISCEEKVGAGTLVVDVYAGGVLCNACRRKAKYPQAFSLNAAKLYHLALHNSLASLSKIKIDARDLRFLEAILKSQVDSLV